MMVEASPPSKTRFVYEWLKEEILSGSLEPGSRIRQQDVARTLGVSYTPVREAIRQLQATGLIAYEPNRGNAVNSLDEDSLRELYLLRGAVEGLGARLAADRMTDAVVSELTTLHESMVSRLDGESDAPRLSELSRSFHGLIVRTGGPLVIHAKTQEIWTHYPIPRAHSLWSSLPHARRSVTAHAAILDALIARDGQLAGTLMEQHIVDSVRFRLDRFS